eukprot:7391411-Prymnesium_polylepis.2
MALTRWRRRRRRQRKRRRRGASRRSHREPVERTRRGCHKCTRWYTGAAKSAILYVRALCTTAGCRRAAPRGGGGVAAAPHVASQHVYRARRCARNRRGPLPVVHEREFAEKVAALVRAQHLPSAAANAWWLGTRRLAARLAARLVARLPLRTRLPVLLRLPLRLHLDFRRRFRIARRFILAALHQVDLLSLRKRRMRVMQEEHVAGGLRACAARRAC